MYLWISEAEIKEIISRELTFLSKTTKSLVNTAFARFSFCLKGTLRTATIANVVGTNSIKVMRKNLTLFVCNDIITI